MSKADDLGLPYHSINYYDYFNMVSHIKKKYGIDERDYSGRHKFDWVGEAVKLGKTKEEAELLYRTSPLDMNDADRAISDQVRALHAQWSEERPYQDFWHFMLEYFDPFDRGKPLHLNWSGVLELAKEDWQKEIAQMYLNEFGDEDYTVIIDW